jgi:hypothetical protein
MFWSRKLKLDFQSLERWVKNKKTNNEYYSYIYFLIHMRHNNKSIIFLNLLL